MDGLERHGGILVGALAALGGLSAAAIGATQSDPVLLWGGLFVAVVGVIFGKPRDPTTAIDERAAELK